MSRALNNPLPGEINVPIALDGIAIVANAVAVDPGFALADVLTTFCGADGLGADNEASCAAPNRVAGAKFRRDDASGTTEVSSNIVGVSQASSEAGSSAANVLTASGELRNEAESLRQEIDTFLSQIRAA